MASVALVVIALFGLAAIGISARHTGEGRLTRQSEAAAIDKVSAVLDRQRRGLDELAQLAASQSDAMVQHFLDRLPSLLPGIRAAAIADAGGTVQLRRAASADPLAALAADAAKIAGRNPARRYW